MFVKNEVKLDYQSYSFNSEHACMHGLLLDSVEYRRLTLMEPL